MKQFEVRIQTLLRCKLKIIKTRKERFKQEHIFLFAIVVLSFVLWFNMLVHQLDEEISRLCPIQLPFLRLFSCPIETAHPSLSIIKLLLLLLLLLVVGGDIHLMVLRHKLYARDFAKDKIPYNGQNRCDTSFLGGCNI